MAVNWRLPKRGWREWLTRLTRQSRRYERVPLCQSKGLESSASLGCWGESLYRFDLNSARGFRPDQP